MLIAKETKANFLTLHIGAKVEIMGRKSFQQGSDIAR